MTLIEQAFESTRDKFINDGLYNTVPDAEGYFFEAGWKAALHWRGPEEKCEVGRFVVGILENEKTKERVLHINKIENFIHLPLIAWCYESELIEHAMQSKG